MFSPASMAWLHIDYLLHSAALFQVSPQGSLHNKVKNTLYHRRGKNCPSDSKTGGGGDLQKQTQRRAPARLRLWGGKKVKREIVFCFCFFNLWVSRHVNCSINEKKTERESWTSTVVNVKFNLRIVGCNFMKINEQFSKMYASPAAVMEYDSLSGVAFIRLGTQAACYHKLSTQHSHPITLISCFGCCFSTHTCTVPVCVSKCARACKTVQNKKK